jgi:hypothetical protein
MKTLQQKFEEVDTNHKNYLEGIEEVADEYAINFAKWCRFAFTKEIYKSMACDELLYQYKKENLLNTI